MGVVELTHGRGALMPAYELVEWQAEENIRSEERLHRELEARSRAAMGKR